VDNCLGGYNSSIFAYGQTGAGKTYTMQGPLSAALQDDNPQVWRILRYSSSEQDPAEQCMPGAVYPAAVPCSSASVPPRCSSDMAWCTTQQHTRVICTLGVDT
jgi:hypothetical protein